MPIQCNDNFFEKIDNELKAYWLGFLYADGCVLFYSDKSSTGSTVNTNRITLSMHERDIEHLRNWLVALESKSNILRKAKSGREKVYVYSVINSEKMCKDLIKQGCLQTKSLKLKFPTVEQVPIDLQRHFIRGYFDGDGCISTRSNYTKFNPMRYVRLSFLGTKQFLETLQTIFETNYKLQTPSRAFGFEVGSMNNVKKILTYLYSNSSISLKRKAVMAYPYIRI